jgi:uncharacterized protein
MALAGRIELASSRPPLAELGRVLTDKFGWDAGRAEDAVSQVVRIASVVEPVEAVSKVHEDPDDNRVLEAAAEARADAIVSGDRHLLRLASWRGIQIETPAGFVARLEPPTEHP